MEANLVKPCEAKTRENDERLKSLAEDMMAFSETVLIRIADDALDSFLEPGAPAASACAVLQTGSCCRLQLPQVKTVAGGGGWERDGGVGGVRPLAQHGGCGGGWDRGVGVRVGKI